jgi:membrane-associated phospholipid phosphatase
MFGIVYQGEHYVFDLIAGVAFAVAAYYLTPKLMKFANVKIKKHSPRLKKMLDEFSRA